VTDTVKLTVAQALVRFLAAQEVERDGVRAPFFAGCFSIVGHGNLAGLRQAFARYGDLLPFRQGRNVQAMVHIASGYAAAQPAGRLHLHNLGCRSTSRPTRRAWAPRSSGPRRSTSCARRWTTPRMPRARW
jgi:hypothetical protein